MQWLQQVELQGLLNDREGPCRRRCRGATGAYLSHEDLGEGVGAGAGDVRLGRMESNIEDALVELLAVCGDLLHTGLAFQVPQTHAAIVT